MSYSVYAEQVNFLKVEIFKKKEMKKLLTLVFLAGSMLITQAQEQTWHTDINKAVEISNKTKKPLLLFFTGSDWCGWCIRLQKEVIKTPEFTKWAQDNVVLVELDFPRSKPLPAATVQQNKEIQQMFQIQGYPTIWFVTGKKNGKNVAFDKLGSTGYMAGGPSAWIANANTILKQ